MIQTSLVEQMDLSPPVTLWHRPRASHPVDGAASGGLNHLAIAREMLATIDDLTVAGRRYTMGKIVEIFAGLMARRGPEAAGQGRFILVRLLHELRQESSRSFPDPSRFTQRASEALSLLGDTV